MKRLFLCFALAACVFGGGTASAQITVEIGDPAYATWDDIGPFYGYYPDTFYGHIISGADMLANGAPAGGGKIRAVAYYVGYLYYPTALTDITNLAFKIGHTTATQTTVIIPSPDKIPVWSGDYPPQANQWNYIHFDQSFEWDGSSNIWIESCFDYPGNTYYTLPYGLIRAYYTYPDQYIQYGLGADPNGNYCNYPTMPYLYSYYERPCVRLEICNAPATMASFSAPGAIYLPDVLPIDWSVSRTEGIFDATVTFNFYTPGGQFVESQSITVPINANAVSGTYYYPITNIAPGFYKLEVVVNALNECNEMDDIVLKQSVMILAPGSTPCEVWPGDVNRDDIVNYGDRKDLNDYIHEGNLRATWMEGPARYRADADVNPLTYYVWEAQYSVPWFTPDGCHMDTDGNGFINNFDYIAIKLNWNRTAGGIASKQDAVPARLTFDLAQNYPNPFNPSTTIRYTVPERSEVRMQVFDMFGREVSTLVNRDIDPGSHDVNFEGVALPSGQYLARINASGLETGYTFSKTIRMTLSK